MAGEPTTLQKAIDLVGKATAADEAKEYAEAYSLYRKALDYFMVAVKCEQFFEKLKTNYY